MPLNLVYCEGLISLHILGFAMDVGKKRFFNVSFCLLLNEEYTSADEKHRSWLPIFNVAPSIV